MKKGEERRGEERRGEERRKERNVHEYMDAWTKRGRER
jgi:hypothetical protein